MATPRDLLNAGDLNQLGAAAKAAGLGSLLAGENGYRLVGETVAVSGAAATPTYNCKKLIYARTIATGAPAEKATTGIAGSAPGAGFAAPNSGGTSIVFHVETTGTGTAEVIYFTTDPVKIGGVTKAGLLTDVPGITG